MANGKTYYKVDLEKIKKKAEELGSGRYWKPKEGKNVIRILPPWNDQGLFYYEAILHYGFQSEGRNRAYPCLVMFNEKCPVCKFIRESGDEDLARRLQPRRRFYSNILDRSTGNIQIWGYSLKTLRELFGYIQDPDWGDFTNPYEGHDIVVERIGTGRNDTRYSVRIKPKPSEIGVSNWEDKLANLSEEIVEYVSEKELEEIIEENFGSAKYEGEEGQNKEFNPKKKGEYIDDEEETYHKENKKETRSQDEDDDEEEEEDLEIDDEDEYEEEEEDYPASLPKRKRGRPSKNRPRIDSSTFGV